MDTATNADVLIELRRNNGLLAEVLAEVARTNQLLVQAIELLERGGNRMTPARAGAPSQGAGAGAYALGDAPTVPPGVEWTVTKSGKGWTGLWGGFLDDEGNDVRLLVNTGREGYGATAFGKDGQVEGVGWHNGGTANQAATMLVAFLERGNAGAGAGGGYGYGGGYTGGAYAGGGTATAPAPGGNDDMDVDDLPF